METLPWFWIWIVAAAILCVSEMLTVTFFLLPFAVGAAVAAIANILGADLLIQWVIFVVVSVVALIAVRPFAKRITKSTAKKSGVDHLVGLTGKIVEGNAPIGFARAIVENQVWNVSTVSGELPEIGASIRVLEVDGAHLVVETVE